MDGQKGESPTVTDGDLRSALEDALSVGKALSELEAVGHLHRRLVLEPHVDAREGEGSGFGERPGVEAEDGEPHAALIPCCRRENRRG